MDPVIYGKLAKAQEWGMDVFKYNATYENADIVIIPKIDIMPSAYAALNEVLPVLENPYYIQLVQESKVFAADLAAARRLKESHNVNIEHKLFEVNDVYRLPKVLDGLESAFNDKKINSEIFTQELEKYELIVSKANSTITNDIDLISSYEKGKTFFFVDTRFLGLPAFEHLYDVWTETRNLGVVVLTESKENEGSW